MTNLSPQQPVNAGVLGMFRNLFPRLVLMGVAIAVAACVALDGRPPQEIVRERAQARWDALVRSDIPAAYSYLSPGSRSVTSLERYAASINKGFWKSVVVHDAVCSTDSCEVSATIEYEFQGRRTTTPYKEKWIREGSNWWFLQG